MIIPKIMKFGNTSEEAQYMTIASESLVDVETVRDMRDSLMNLLEVILGENHSNMFLPKSLWWILQLIDATTTVTDEELKYLEKGGKG